MNDEFLRKLEIMREKTKAALGRAEMRHSHARQSMETKRQQLESIETVIRLHSNPVHSKQRTGSQTAGMILDIVKANSAGLLSSQIVELLQAEGVRKSPTSVGMYLSKLQGEGLVEQVGRNWRVPTNDQEPAGASTPAGSESGLAFDDAGQTRGSPECPVADEAHDSWGSNPSF